MGVRFSALIFRRDLSNFAARLVLLFLVFGIISPSENISFQQIMCLLDQIGRIRSFARIFIHIANRRFRYRGRVSTTRETIQAALIVLYSVCAYVNSCL